MGEQNLSLQEVSAAIVDCEHKTAPRDPEGDYFAVGTPAMRGNTINLSEARRISKETFRSWTRRLTPQHGDLLLAREAPVGPVIRIPPSENVAPGQRTVLIRPKPDLCDSRYLYYYLASPTTQMHLASMAEGSTVPHLNVADVRKVTVQRLPRLSEQRAIAEVLGALDDKIAANDRLADTASSLAQMRFEHASRQQPTTSINAVLEPILGGTPPRSDPSLWGGEHLWISAKDITKAPSSVVLDTEEKITAHAVASTKAKPLPRGSVIVTARGTVGKVARLGNPASFNQSCYGFRPDSLPPGVLYLSIVNAMQRALSFAHGSVFSTITKKTFDYLEIPSFKSEGLAVIEQTIAPLLDTVEAAMRENNALAATRDALLPALMSGKLRVKDAERQVEAVV